MRKNLLAVLLAGLLALGGAACADGGGGGDAGTTPSPALDTGAVSPPAAPTPAPTGS